MSRKTGISGVSLLLRLPMTIHSAKPNAEVKERGSGTPALWLTGDLSTCTAAHTLLWTTNPSTW